MSTSVNTATAHKNQALCVAGLEFGIGDTIPQLTYSKYKICNGTTHKIQETITNSILTKVEYNHITIETTTGSTIKIATKDISEITEKIA